MVRTRNVNDEYNFLRNYVKVELKKSKEKYDSLKETFKSLNNLSEEQESKLLNDLYEEKNKIKDYNELNELFENLSFLFYMPVSEYGDKDKQIQYIYNNEIQAMEDLKNKNKAYDRLISRIVYSVPYDKELGIEDIYNKIHEKFVKLDNNEETKNEAVLYSLMLDYLKKKMGGYYGPKIAFDLDNNKPVLGNYFSCDVGMVETIRILREKGYNTVECCSGHADEFGTQVFPSGSPFNKEFEISGDKKEQLKELIYDNYRDEYSAGIKIFKIEEKDGKRVFHYNSIWNYYRTFIYFRDTELAEDNVPEGFKIENYGGNSVIQKIYPCKKIEDGLEIDRPLYEIEKEIEEANKKLLEWAKKLEPYSKDNKNKKVTK